MKPRCLPSPFLPLMAIVLIHPIAWPVSPSGTQQLSAAYGKLSLSFEANRGQTDPRVRFLVHGHGYSLFLSDDEAVISLATSSTLDKRTDHRSITTAPLKTSVSLDSQSVGTQQLPTVLRMRLLGTTHTLPSGLDRLPGVSNYFSGSNP